MSALEALLVVDFPLPLLHMGLHVLSQLLTRIRGMDDGMVRYGNPGFNAIPCAESPVICDHMKARPESLFICWEASILRHLYGGVHRARHVLYLCIAMGLAD